MANEFAVQAPTLQDNETILWKKFADWLYTYAVAQGASGLVVPNDSQNETMLIRSAAYNAFALTGSSPPPPTPVPVNTVAPALDDTSVGVGDTVSCGTGTWTNTPTSYTYQWKRDGVSIGGETSNSYLVAVADVGSVLTCEVTAHNAGGASSPATSNATDVVPGSFVPTDIAGCKIWLDADQIIGLSDNDPVVTWEDESGNGLDVTQGTSGFRPVYKTGIINSLPIVRSDGTNDFLAAAAPVGITGNNYSIFIVCTGTANSKKFLGEDNAASRGWAMSDGGGFEPNGAADPTGWGLGAAVFGLIEAIGDSGKWLNGTFVDVIVNTGTIPAHTGFLHVEDREYVGAEEWYAGDIAEVVIYDTALSTPNRQLVETYLMDKYGL